MIASAFSWVRHSYSTDAQNDGSAPPPPTSAGASEAAAPNGAPCGAMASQKWREKRRRVGVFEKVRSSCSRCDGSGREGEGARARGVLLLSYQLGAE